MNDVEKRIIRRLKSLRQLLKDEGYMDEYIDICFTGSSIHINNDYWEGHVRPLDLWRSGYES